MPNFRDLIRHHLDRPAVEAKDLVGELCDPPERSCSLDLGVGLVGLGDEVHEALNADKEL